MRKNKEIKAGAGYTIGNILIKGISFISLPIFSRILSTQDYGLYNTYVAYEALITIIIGLGMHAAIKNSQFDYRNRVQTFISTQIIIVSMVVFLLLILCAVFRAPIERITGFGFVIIFFLILQSFGSAILNILNAKLALKYNYKNYLYYAGFNTVTNVLLSILLIFTVCNNNRLLGRVLGTALPMIIIGIRVVFKEIPKKTLKFDKGMALYALKFGFPLIWHYLSQQVASQFDRIMIANMVSVSATGIYCFVYAIANIFQILFYSTDNVWSVWFFKQMKDQNYGYIKKRSFHYILLMAGLVCIMMVVSREVIMIMGGKAYWEGVDLFIPIVIGVYFLFLYTIPVGIEYYYKETKYIAASTFLSAFVNVLLNYIFIMMYGYTAAAYTTAVSYLVMFASHWIISSRILKKHGIDQFLNLGNFIIVSIGVCLFGTACLFLNSHTFIKYTIFIIGITINCCIFKRELKIFFHKMIDNKK